MGFFTKKKHSFTDDCIYDPYYDFESEIVGEVQRIILDQECEELPDYEKFLREHEEERKHLVALFDIAEACDIHEMTCFLLSARRSFPDLWAKINYKADKEQRELLIQYENVSSEKKGVDKN